jgi:capsular polysaccharide biosynthesis protein
MDLLSIVRTIWRHKIAATPVILIAAIGAFYVFAIKHPQYQASASVVLLSAPTPPTQGQIAADPKLGKINANNPYASYGDLTAVADIVISLVTSSSSQQALVQAGADPRYQIGLNPDGAPILVITGIGTTAEEAIRSANLVASAARVELFQMQERQGVNPHYMITSVQAVSPEQAQLVLSGKLRTLIAVLGLSIILLFIVVSAAEALDKRRSSINAAMPTTADEDARRPFGPAASSRRYGADPELQRSPKDRLAHSDRFPAFVSRRNNRS